MSGPAALLADRLRALTALPAADIDALTGLFTERQPMTAERLVVSEGDAPRRLHLLTDGLAARVKLLRDGTRHLCALLVPGDLADVDGLHVRHYDYGVVALAGSTLWAAEREDVLALTGGRPGIARALTWLGFVDNAMGNEAAASLARRPAAMRVAHLFCELEARLRSVGRAERHGFALPLSQAQLGEALGLTGVHVNRMLRVLRDAGLATFSHGRVSVPDWPALRRYADFTADYLHPDGMRPVPA